MKTRKKVRGEEGQKDARATENREKGNLRKEEKGTNWRKGRGEGRSERKRRGAEIEREKQTNKNR